MGVKMYGKHFQSTYSGSMIGLGPLSFAVWGYVIANTVNGYVELNPILLAAIFGKTTPEEIEDAIQTLCAPDPKSRNKDHDGRRLIREGEFSYFVPTHSHYVNIRNESDRRDYMREYMRKRRQEEMLTVNTANSKQRKPPLAHIDTDTYTYTNTDTVKQKRGHFMPPSLQEITDYCKERQNTVSPEQFLNFYESKGWMVGKTKMKDWKACIRTWEQRQTGDSNGQKDTRTRTKRHIDKLDEIARADIAENGFTNHLD